MKKKYIFTIIIILLISILFGINLKTPEEIQNSQTELSKYVSDNGWLKVDNSHLKNEKGQDFLLKGISSHGIQWYSDILTYDNLKELKDSWNINVFRIAMYTNENGYISNKELIKEKLINITNIVVDLDMYVVIDWHTLTDNNPNTYIDASKDFFDEISTLYKDTPNVIYEICNEPNGKNVTWDAEIKHYADEIIPVIRKNSPRSLIIVGTPDWCKELKPVIKNPLNYNNILYSCHFYAGSHKEKLRNEIENAIQNNLPIIVSEWGTTDASGNGEIFEDETRKWIDFLNSKNISFIYWSFSNKNESSAILTSDYSLDEEKEKNESINSFLTISGKLVKALLVSKP